MRNKYLTIVFLFCIHSYSQNTGNINEAPPSAFQYQGVPEVNLHKTDAEISTYKRDDLENPTKKAYQAEPLTEDYFSNLGSKPKKERFESYTIERKKEPKNKKTLSELVFLNDKKLNPQQTTEEPSQGLNYDHNSSNIFNNANIIFTLLGLTIFGILIRGLFNNHTVSNKPKNIYAWIIQLIISMIVGAFIWFLVIPKSCKRESDYDPADIIILKSK